MNAMQTFAILVVLQTVVVTAAALIAAVCLRRRPALRHAVGVVGLALVLMSPVLALLLPRPGWLPPEAENVATPDQPAFPVEPATAPPAPAADWSSVEEFATLPPPAETIEGSAVVPQPPATVSTSPQIPLPQSWSDRWHTLTNALHDGMPFMLATAAGVWILGVIWSALNWLRLHRQLWALRASLRDWPAERPIGDADAICAELGLRELPPIKVSALAPTPLVLGVLRPLVVLPEMLAETTNPRCLHDVVMHEAAHVARRDAFVLVAQQAAAGLFWWHPGVWLLNRSISRAREEVCDNYVLRRSEPSEYAQLLLELVEASGGRRLALSLLGLLPVRWSLEQRIAGLLNPQRNTGTRPGRAAVLVATLLLGTLCAGVGGVGALEEFRRQLPSRELTTGVAPAATAETQLAAQNGTEVASGQSAEPAKSETSAGTGSAESDTRKLTLRGTCEDEDQRPLAGVRVRVYRIPSRVDTPELVADTTTDAQGRFVVENVETDAALLELEGKSELVVAATADNRASAISRIHDEKRSLSLALALHSNPGTLSGVVRDESGKPVAGAAVYLPTAHSHPLPGIMSAVTDDDGRYSIPDLRCWKSADTEKYHFYVRHPDFAVTMAQNTAVPQTVDVTLYPPAVVTGRVIDAVTDQPAAGVIVSAQGIARHGSGRTRTDSAGQYTLRLTRDHYNIWAEMPDRIAIAVKAIEAKRGETATSADIKMVGGGIVFGTLIDPGTNQPIQPTEGQKLRVGHYGPARPRSGAAVANAVVQPDGSYRLRVAPGRNYVYLMSGGHGGVYLEVADGQELRHDIRIGELSPDSIADPDPDIELGNRIRQQARDEDAVAERRAGNAPLTPAARERGDSPVGKLLDELEQQNASDNERFREPWLRTIKEIVGLGPQAVPELIAELDATTDNMMLRCVGFTLRAIGDKRAVPALIRAIPKTLMPSSSDMGLQADDVELVAFAQQHDLDNQNTGNEYGFGRPVREVFGALHQLTGQKFNEEELYSVHLQGTRKQQRLQRQLFDTFARRWADWWDEHWSEHVDDANYARVQPPDVADSVAAIAPVKEPRYRTGSGNSGWVLESALNAEAGRHELFDLDTGRAAPVPRHWRKTIGNDGYRAFVMWANEQGYELLGHEYVVPGTERRVYAIRRLSGEFWELGDDAWKQTYTDVTLGALQAQGRQAGDYWLLHRDAQAGEIDPLVRATFLFKTSEETSGLLYIGVEVQDDSQQPGGFAEGDNELLPVAFNKGRRFAFTFFEELTSADKRASWPAVQTLPNDAPAVTSIPATSDANVWGGIAGQFVLEGDAPQLSTLVTVNGESVPDESLLVNPENKGIANVCLYLREAPAAIHPSLQKSSVPSLSFGANKGRFVPHVLVARTDQTILLMNNDPQTINIHSMLLKNPPINQVLSPNFRPGPTVQMTRSENKGPPVKVVSDIQPWMAAYWLVTDHPYVAVTDADGKFKIENLPPGEHKFRVWHERFGFVTTDAFRRDLTVVVKPGETVSLPAFRVEAEGE